MIALASEDDAAREPRQLRPAEKEKAGQAHRLTGFPFT
jgi:hypothetical protein